ncbi:MAG: hypothetical protein ACYC3W_10625 [Candidatus Nanopelagicales bacterium]
MKREEDIVRSMIQREDELINHRLTILATVQGLLFAAAGFVWDKADGNKLIKILCWLGLFIAVVSLSSLFGSTRAMSRLLSWWEEKKPIDYDGPGVMGMPPNSKIVSFISKFIGPWSLFPMLFIVAWMAIWILKCRG